MLGFRAANPKTRSVKNLHAQAAGAGARDLCFGALWFGRGVLGSAGCGMHWAWGPYRNQASGLKV